jgi:hypothetical protein
VASDAANQLPATVTPPTEQVDLARQPYQRPNAG